MEQASEHRLNMAAVNFDFMPFDDDLGDDILLSQACEEIEALDGVYNLSLTQCISKYSMTKPVVDVDTDQSEDTALENKTGPPTPPRSLYLIICGLLRHLRDYDVNDKNLLDSKNGVFCGFGKVLDAKMKELLSNGHGTTTKQAQPLMPEDEKLWQNNVFGSDTAESLQATMFFYSCKLFGLRGHDEHHDLKCDQFSVGTDQYGKFVEFTGRNTKTYRGGLEDREISNKRIRHNSKEGDRCILNCICKPCRVDRFTCCWC
ncbi:hypothetical protein ScPMuIL_009315 [Solemya velum]